MSVNLPTSSGNEEVLRVASTSTAHGKFGVAQQMHTHSGRFYGPDYAGLEFYGIVPLFDMNAMSAALGSIAAALPDLSYLLISRALDAVPHGGAKCTYTVTPPSFASLISFQNPRRPALVLRSSHTHRPRGLSLLFP